MNLLLIVRKIWRYKLATVPVVILTLFGAVYVLAVVKPVYEASSSYVLINPPAPPTAEDIARDPALGRIEADNPYTRFAEQSVVVEVLASTLGSESARRALAKEGADRRYTVESTSEFGYASPIVEITGVGPTPQVALRTANVVGNAVSRELNRVQKAEGVDPSYRITTHPVDTPDRAQRLASGQLRMLVGVLALGAILLFGVVSVADALTTLRVERAKRPVPSRLGGNEEAWLAQDEFAHDMSGADQPDWSGVGSLDVSQDLNPETGPDQRPERRVSVVPSAAARVKILPRRRGAADDGSGDHVA